MVPYIFAMRMMANANANPTPEKPMACSKPCYSCDCENRDTVYCNDYIEADASPLATQAKKFLAEEEARRAASPAGFYDRYCGENPSAPECKIYED